MNRRTFTKKTILASASAIAIPNINFGKTSEENIIGHGTHQYRLKKNWADFGNIPVNDCHEMIEDSKGRLVFNTNELKNNVIICDKKGKLIKTWGNEYPGAHGLTCFNENGTDVIFLTDSVKRKIVKATIDGKIIFEKEAPFDSNKYNKEHNKYSPTEITVLPNGDFYVADGYGEQYITHYNTKGDIINMFGGYGEENEKFTQCHGIAFDNRDPKQTVLLITDRMKHQLKRFTLDGKYLSTIQFSNIWNCRPVVHGENVYMAVLKCSADLFWKEDLIKGCVLILDKDNKPISAPGATAPTVKNGTMSDLVQNFPAFQFPHDVCIDNEGSLYVTQWNSNKVYPYKFERIN